ncbi:hypothetical protein M2305_002677 [Gluconobacter cerinus]|nr:hypothetical protein [Gluconobacter cerinus]MCW2266730.1 hypothetical protein [Gluconobacter cerinus]
MKQFPAELLVLARACEEKLKLMYPAHKRDHEVFDALETVNSDGHKFDVFVKWPVGDEEQIVRPSMMVFRIFSPGKSCPRGSTFPRTRKRFGWRSRKWWSGMGYRSTVSAITEATLRRSGWLATCRTDTGSRRRANCYPFVAWVSGALGKAV